MARQYILTIVKYYMKGLLIVVAYLIERQRESSACGLIHLGGALCVSCVVVER